MKIGDAYMLPDDMKEFLSDAEHIVNFHSRLGNMWRIVRSHHFKKLPRNLVDALDEIAGIVRCDEDGCLERPHRDWDFCRKHGS